MTETPVKPETSAMLDRYRLELVRTLGAEAGHKRTFAVHASWVTISSDGFSNKIRVSRLPSMIEGLSKRPDHPTIKAAA